MAVRVDVRMLGRPQVVVNDVVTPIVGRQLLLALRLAVAERVPISLGRLVDDVWPDSAGTEGAARVGLTRLRNVLGHDAIVRTQGGYTLAPEVGVDAERFEQLLLRGRDRSLEIRGRARTLDEALTEWRGRAFEDVETLDWVESVSVRLNELREQAVDLRFELRLVDGEPASLVCELRSALDRCPTRERRAEMLALALYRAGRQSEALEAISRVRTTLRDRLGLALSPALSELEMRILRQDPDLIRTVRERDGRAVDRTDSRLRAAVALIRIGVYEEALTIIDATIAEARADGDQRTLARALLAQAQALSLSGGGDPHALIDQAQAIARVAGNGQLLAQAALVRVGRGVPEDKTLALVELTEPLELLAADAPERVDLLCAAAVIVTFIDGSPAAERLLDAAQKAHESTRSPRSEAVWLAARSIVAAVHGADAAVVHEMAMKSYDAARSADDATVMVAAIQGLLRAEYTLGNLTAVDELLPVLDRAAETALLPFGAVRVSLCKTTNALARGRLDEVPQLIDATLREGNRYRTFNAEIAAGVQQLLLLFERDEVGLLADLVRLRAKERGPSVWHAVLALCEPDGDDAPLIELAPLVPVDDSFWPFVALAAEAGARRQDAAIGAWCASRLDHLADRTITVGLGTIVMGFAAHFAGLAHVACGDLDAARVRFDRALTLAARNGAALWEAHSKVELTDVLARSDDGALVAEGLRLLAELGDSAITTQSARVARRVAEVSRLVERC